MDAATKKQLEKTAFNLEQFERSPYPVICEPGEWQEFMLPAEDGTGLRTMYCLPQTEGPFPCIVQRTCYPKEDYLNRLYGQELNRRGYVYVYQYCRGVGGSEGEWVPNIYERQDGNTLLQWVNAQEWVEVMGYLGHSYLACTGWAIADLAPEKMASMYLTHYGTDRFTSAYEKGSFRHDILTGWAMGNAGFPVDADYMESCRFRPHVKVDEALWGRKIDWYRDWITNTNRTDPYWNTGFWELLYHMPEKVRIPIYMAEGWYDHHLGSAINGWNRIPDDIRKHCVLQIGCWDHGFHPCMEEKEQENLDNYDVLHFLDWFHETLVEKRKPEGRIKGYIIGADQWKEWKSLEDMTGAYRILYLDADARQLTDQPGENGGTGYVYDPNDPVLSYGSESCFTTKAAIGSLLQPEPDYRPDVISFISEPLKEAATIAGEIQVELYVSTDVKDTAFTGKLMEIAPDGKTRNIRGSITTIASDLTAGEEYEPGTAVKVNVSMWTVAWELQQGARLRLDISSSDFPQYSVHPNREGGWAEAEDCLKANQKIMTGKDYPSRVVLPLMNGE